MMSVKYEKYESMSPDVATQNQYSLTMKKGGGGRWRGGGRPVRTMSTMTTTML